MTIGQEFWKEVESEMKASRRLVERGPDDKVQWKPHPKSAALGHLTQLVCRMPKLMSDIVKGIDPIWPPDPAIASKRRRHCSATSMRTSRRSERR